jgi:hypothetical protein
MIASHNVHLSEILSLVLEVTDVILKSEGINYKTFPLLLMVINILQQPFQTTRNATVPLYSVIQGGMNIN